MSLGLRNQSFLWTTCLLVLYFSPAMSQFRGKITTVELSGGKDPAEGNVMVATDIDPESHPLCDNSFGMTEANAVCVAMGFPRALRFTRHNYFPLKSYRWSPDDWKSMYILDCPKNDNITGIQRCSLLNNREDLCTPIERAGVVCQLDTSISGCSINDFVCGVYNDQSSASNSSSSSSSSSCIQEPNVCDGFPDCPDGSDEKPELCDVEGVMRLESTIKTSLPNNTVAGTVFMKYNGTWSIVCDNKFDKREAEVICRNLGYNSGKYTMNVPFVLSYFGEGTGDILADESTCLGDEMALNQCPGFLWGESDCIHSGDAGVFCHDGLLGVQLVGGSSSDSGRLEITSSSLSLPAGICDTGFDDLDAQVVCRMLGYDGTQAVGHKGSSAFGKGSGDIWNIILDCIGNETSIQDCRIKISNNTCTHGSTAAVTCLRERSVEEMLSRVLPADCGQPLDASDQFITSLGKVRGGQVASRFDVPWLAALRVRIGTEYLHQCGAVIISEFYLLSAATCFETVGKLNSIVSVGDFNANHDERSQQDYFIDKLWIHEDFGELGFGDNDLVLIKVEAIHGRGMRLGAHVKAVCLPQLGDSYEELGPCSLTGWGSITDSSNVQSLPRTAQIGSFPDNLCEFHYGSRIYTSSMSCFGKLAFINSCKGDAGGPLTCKSPQGHHVLYGISSIGKACNPEVFFPGIFVRLTKYLRWIQETIARDLRLK